MKKRLMAIGTIVSQFMIFGFDGTAFAERTEYFNFPSHAKVKIERSTQANKPSFIYLEFMWENSNCSPNFGEGRAVEVEVHVDNHCFLQPPGGIDNDDSCDKVMGKGKYHLPPGNIPGGDPNCYVDVWNYKIPSANQIVPAIEEHCGPLSLVGAQCAQLAVSKGLFSEKDGNFTVGLHDASALQAGVLYSIRYPVEINNSPECQDLTRYKENVGSECGVGATVHNDWGRAWVTMQTFSNTCVLTWPCDNYATPYTCPQLIGAVGTKYGKQLGCVDADKYTDFWLNRLCVPTGDWAFTPGYGGIKGTGGVCINEGNSSDLNTYDTCCIDADHDGYYRFQQGYKDTYTPVGMVSMYGTQTGDCKDADSSVHPAQPQGPLICIAANQESCPGADPAACLSKPSLCSDGIQNQGETGIDCGGPCQVCNGGSTCSDGIQNQGESGIDCGGPCSACPTCSDGKKNGAETGVDCGGSCPVCLPPGPVALASGLNSPFNLALDATSVYWVDNNSPGTLKKVPKNGGQVTTLSNALLFPTAVTVAGGYAYVLELNQNMNNSGSIRRINVNGGNLEAVVSGLQGACNFLMQDVSKLYFVDGLNTANTTIKSAPFGASVNASVIVQGTSLGPSLDIDGSYVYFSNGLNQMLRAPQGGGNADIIASGHGVSSVRVDGATIYYVDTTDSQNVTINKMPKAGGAPTILGQAQASSGSNLAVYGTNVYWIESANPGGVYGVGVNGGATTTYSQSTGYTLGLAVDGTYLYWTERIILGQGKIMRAPK